MNYGVIVEMKKTDGSSWWIAGSTPQQNVSLAFMFADMNTAKQSPMLIPVKAMNPGAVFIFHEAGK